MKLFGSSENNKLHLYPKFKKMKNIGIFIGLIAAFIIGITLTIAFVIFMWAIKFILFGILVGLILLILFVNFINKIIDRKKSGYKKYARRND